jgi:hypothetical protein
MADPFAYPGLTAMPQQNVPPPADTRMTESEMKRAGGGLPTQADAPPHPLVPQSQSQNVLYGQQVSVRAVFNHSVVPIALTHCTGSSYASAWSANYDRTDDYGRG